MVVPDTPKWATYSVLLFSWRFDQFAETHKPSNDVLVLLFYLNNNAEIQEGGQDNKLLCGGTGRGGVLG